MQPCPFRSTAFNRQHYYSDIFISWKCLEPFERNHSKGIAICKLKAHIKQKTHKEPIRK